MINKIPKARIKFRDGHTEDSIVVLLFSDKDFIAVTQSGAYRPKWYFKSYDEWHYILKYFPELANAQVGTHGTDFSFIDCWAGYEDAEQIELWFEPIKEKGNKISEVYKIGGSYCLDLKGKSIIRKYSCENHWLDYVVIVPKQFEERAVYLVNKAYDDFWETDSVAYGDLVEEYLEKAGIPFDVIYHDPDEEDIDSEYEKSWESFIDSLNKNCV